MRIAFAVFVKTPGLSPIKTRLASSIGRTRAEQFYSDSLIATKAVVEGVAAAVSKTIAKALPKTLAKPMVDAYWAVAEETGLNHSFWNSSPHWQVILQRGEGLGERLANIYGELKSRYDIVCLYGADSPHVKSEVLAAALQKLIVGGTVAASVVVGPTEDGGFYFLAGSMPIAHDIWCKVKYSTEHTWRDLRAQLVAAKMAPDVASGGIVEVEKNFDIDTGEDFERLNREFSNWRRG